MGNVVITFLAVVALFVFGYLCYVQGYNEGVENLKKEIDKAIEEITEDETETDTDREN